MLKTIPMAQITGRRYAHITPCAVAREQNKYDDDVDEFCLQGSKSDVGVSAGLKMLYLDIFLRVLMISESNLFVNYVIINNNVSIYISKFCVCRKIYVQASYQRKKGDRAKYLSPLIEPTTSRVPV